jgi:hypothetical protein
MFGLTATTYAAFVLFGLALNLVPGRLGLRFAFTRER